MGFLAIVTIISALTLVSADSATTSSISSTSVAEGQQEILEVLDLTAAPKPDFDFYVFAQLWPLSDCLAWEIETHRQHACVIPSKMNFMLSNVIYSFFILTIKLYSHSPWITDEGLHRPRDLADEDGRDRPDLLQQDRGRLQPQGRGAHLPPARPRLGQRQVGGRGRLRLLEARVEQARHLRPEGHPRVRHGARVLLQRSVISHV